MSFLFNVVVLQGQRRFGMRQGLSDSSSRSIMVMWCESPDELMAQKNQTIFALSVLFLAIDLHKLKPTTIACP